MQVSFGNPIKLVTLNWLFFSLQMIYNIEILQGLGVIHATRGKTGLVFDKGMAEHQCLWDENHPECPERFTRVVERCVNSRNSWNSNDSSRVIIYVIE